jgi:hypothetical protein
MRKTAQKQLDYDEAEEEISRVINRILKHRTYKQIHVSKLKAFLGKAIYLQVTSVVLNQQHRTQTVTRLPEDSDLPYVFIETRYEEPVLVECPFCFRANLNQYGACAMCGTIVPSHYRTPQNTIRMDHESLAVEFDFNRQIDVARAIARLEPKEQMVVRLVGLGHETLDSVAELQPYTRDQLHTTWLKAKQKLQRYLHEYDERALSKKTPSEFSHALKRAIDSTC